MHGGGSLRRTREEASNLQTQRQFAVRRQEGIGVAACAGGLCKPFHVVHHRRCTTGVDGVVRVERGQEGYRAAMARGWQRVRAGSREHHVVDTLPRQPVERRPHVEIARVARGGDQHDRAMRLAKPGRDPRQKFEAFAFDAGVHKPEDLKPGIAVQLIPGATINLGDGITIQVTRP